ncbi:hypothetical protein CEUSTIGMA_g11706.t1 [Chlamydomonas eustigma]|uniref:Uncharacterized protein n=1 Tax=Chlamydomonas eustigma TaxID=1157962 RepID=A0A250XMG7_9CHLO|nr:hypothetical protein CEUSTIGMA_g11706.t1 [Chlamydomonas eustigma]|eukprot:GAX84284.1 hypothetical protein CEUSTIGMA_g11706.t1 [Chlamydomonas eustigma]
MAGQKTTLASTWSPTGTFDWGEPYIVSLRGKDPKRTSTLSMHVPINRDAAGRCPGVKTHHFGPGQKVIGGQLTFTHEDMKARRVRLERSLDPAEILKQTIPRPSTVTLAAETQHVTIPGRPHTTQEQGASTAAKSTTGKKVVIWDGRHHHILDKDVAGEEAAQSHGKAWTPPHLEHKHVEPGHFIGVREKTGFEGVALIGSKPRLLPDTSSLSHATWSGTNIKRRPGLSGPIPPPYGALKGPYGLKPYAPIHQTTSFGLKGDIDEGTLRSYAHEKLMGYREYESTCKNMEGMQAWRSSQCYLTSSIAIGQSTRLMKPQEHVNTRLSLRRSAVL